MNSCSKVENCFNFFSAPIPAPLESNEIHLSDNILELLNKLESPPPDSLFTLRGRMNTFSSKVDEYSILRKELRIAGSVLIALCVAFIAAANFAMEIPMVIIFGAIVVGAYFTHRIRKKFDACNQDLEKLVYASYLPELISLQNWSGNLGKKEKLKLHEIALFVPRWDEKVSSDEKYLLIDNISGPISQESSRFHEILRVFQEGVFFG